jgi:hypothetical protein
MGDIQTFLQSLTAGVGTASNTPTGTHAASVIEDSQQRQRDVQAKNLTMLQDSAKNQQLIAAHFTDPTTGKAYPQYQTQHDEAMNRFGGLAGQIYESQHPNPESMSFEHKMGIRALSKMHLTNDLNSRIDKWKKHEAQFKDNLAAGGQLPYEWTPERDAEAAKLRDAQTLEKQLSADAIALEGAKKANKPPKGLKAIEAGGIPVAVQDQDTGKQYLPSQLGRDGDAPPEAKQMWQTIQDAKEQKRKDEQRKEDEIAQRQARTIAAGFERMGQTQQFQELMTQYRSDLETYRTLNTQADQTEETMDALKAQYSQPGKKSVADNELQNFYTTVVQKGGRKTAAELMLTLKIGSLGMNIEQMATKAAKGELPPELRKMLLEGMDAVAKEQREVADHVKPELPKISTPSGQIHQKLLKTKQQGGGGSSKMKVKLSDGRVGTIDAGDFDPSTMTKVQ